MIDNSVAVQGHMSYQGECNVLYNKPPDIIHIFAFGDARMALLLLPDFILTCIDFLLFSFIYSLFPLCGVSLAPEVVALLPAHCFGALQRPSAGPADRPAPPPPSPPAETARLSSPPAPPTPAAPPCQSQTTAEDTWHQNVGLDFYQTCKYFRFHVSLISYTTYTATYHWVTFKLPTSPSSICVSTSLPDLAGMKSGVAGLSRKASVWHSISVATMTSLSSSR